MAKKNSSKTATKEALQASEPRIQVFGGWQGIAVQHAPLEWQPREEGDYKFNQDDLKPNFLMVQNNLKTEDNLTIETRMPSYTIGTVPVGYAYTGVATVIYDNIFAALVNLSTGKESLWKTNSTSQTATWHRITMVDGDGGEFVGTITEIGHYQKTIIVLTETSGEAEIFTGEYIVFDGNVIVNFGLVSSVKEVSNPMEGPGDTEGSPNAIHDFLVLTAKGQQGQPNEGQWTPPGETDPQYINQRITIYMSLTSRFGTTTFGTKDGADYCKTIYVPYSPVQWNSNRFLELWGHLSPQRKAEGITGIDFYYTLNNATVPNFLDHIEIDRDAWADGSWYSWSYNWFGAENNNSTWMVNQNTLPDQNTTKGVHATHFTSHDSRLFFWGNPQSPYTLYVGGKPGHELSIARGYGGAWVDIEPGSGYEVMGTAKWKTVQGANIITIMCGNHNTNKVKRFNLVETSESFTNEIASTSDFMYEEVSNVVGCNSRWGYGVFGDGLYSIGRYGLMLTTMATEYNNQMRAQSVSGNIDPVFKDNLGKNLKNARMVCIDDIIYIALANPDLPTELDQLILCYDLNLKTWYTFTHDEIPEAHGEHIRHIMALDSEKNPEGLCVITDNQIRVYPTAGYNQSSAGYIPVFDVILETGELMSRQPKQESHYIQQLELRFDYFIGYCTVYIEGVDYYGRPFQVRKEISKSTLQRDWTEWIRIERYVESYRLRLEGNARFRLVSINSKAYIVSKRIGLPYGYDAYSMHRRRPNDAEMYFDHHPVDNYNNLRRAIIS